MTVQFFKLFLITFTYWETINWWKCSTTISI